MFLTLQESDLTYSPMQLTSYSFLYVKYLLCLSSFLVNPIAHMKNSCRSDSNSCGKFIGLMKFPNLSAIASLVETLGQIVTAGFIKSLALESPCIKTEALSSHDRT